MTSHECVFNSLHRKPVDRLPFNSGIDTRVLIANDRAAIDAELEVQGGGGYILSSDHSEPPDVSYETLRFFLERGRAVRSKPESEALQ